MQVNNLLYYFCIHVQSAGSLGKRLEKVKIIKDQNIVVFFLTGTWIKHQ